MLGAGAVQAQTLYRNVGPDGRVTFSDVPPPAGTGKAAPGGPSAAPASAGSPLPYDLQQVASRYPVTLYTGESCGPCGSGRILLNARGIPFTERTVNSSDDVAALQRLSGDTSLPFLTIGRAADQGVFRPGMDAVPGRSGLSQDLSTACGLSCPAATPLVAVQRPATGTAPASGATPGSPGIETVNTRQRPAPSPAPAANTNPAGIRFWGHPVPKSRPASAGIAAA